MSPCTRTCCQGHPLLRNSRGIRLSCASPRRPTASGTRAGTWASPATLAGFAGSPTCRLSVPPSAAQWRSCARVHKLLCKGIVRDGRQPGRQEHERRSDPGRRAVSSQSRRSRPRGWNNLGRSNGLSPSPACQDRARRCARTPRRRRWGASRGPGRPPRRPGKSQRAVRLDRCTALLCSRRNRAPQGRAGTSARMWEIPSTRHSSSGRT
mmetsp:Transcript_32900/g.99373  ORF Transcript_32900/g.99373 Transcript_32900/m.99373 type:complete len:209 (-) Transcript_32900:3130-3756(-)